MISQTAKTTSKTRTKANEVRGIGTDERYRLLIESIKEYAILFLDQHGRVTEWNRGCKHLFGYDAEDIIGKNFSRFFTFEDRKLDKPKIELQMARENGRADDENWLVRKDKSWFWASGASMPLQDSTGKLVGYTKIVRDLTDRKALDQQREDFVSLASHELRTPLTSIKGYIQMLARHLAKNNDNKANTYLAKLEEEVNRQETLIRDLLDVAKLQTNISREGKVVEIEPLVRQLVEDFQINTATHKLVVKGNTDKRIVGDDQQIRQVVVNLLTNAIKYSPQASEVIITLAATEKEVVVSVQDFGIGILKKDQKRIFDRFVRAENATKQGFVGYGLGLYIVSEVIKHYSGSIKVKSVAGKGSTFTFSLPFVDLDRTEV